MTIKEGKSVSKVLIVSITLILALLVGVGRGGWVNAEDGKDLKINGVPGLSTKLDTIMQTSIPEVGDNVVVARDCCEAVKEQLEKGLFAIGDEFLKIEQKLQAMDSKIDDISSQITHQAAKRWVSPYFSTERHFDPIFDSSNGHADITHISVYNPNFGFAHVTMTFFGQDEEGFNPTQAYNFTTPLGGMVQMEFHEKRDDWTLGLVHGYVIIESDLPVMPHGHVTSVPWRAASGGPDAWHANVGYSMTWYRDDQ